MNKRKIYLWSLAAVAVAFLLAPLAAPWGMCMANAAVSDDLYQDIDVYIEEQLRALNIPGASLAVVAGDQVVHTQGFGSSGKDGAAPTPQTPFFIGSLTKSVTALAVMQLVEAGKVELDVPLQSYLPWFTLKDPDAASRITVRHLLNQTSGLSQIPGMIGLGNFEDSSGAGRQQARALSSREPASPVGSAWEYSNSNYNLLGLVIEAASGESYADYIHKHIFSPLDMSHSYTSKEAARDDGLIDGHMLLFGFPVSVPNLPVPLGSLPSGQLISTTEDMAHYMIAQLNGGLYAGEQLLSAEGIAQMHQPDAEVTMLGEGTHFYGMGWYIDKSGSEEIVMHWGETPDYFAYMALLPERQRGIILMVNADQHMYTYPLIEVGNGAAALLAGDIPERNQWLVLPWALRALLLLPFLQIVCIFTGLRRLNSWRAKTGQRPSKACFWLLHILLPTLLNLIMPLVIVGLAVSGLFKFSLLFMGDMLAVMLISAVISLVWIGVRTSLMLRTQRP